jgi:hypothetical protein
VPARELLRQRTARTTLRVDTASWPVEVRWSVRARWTEAGQLRQTRWLDAQQRPLATALVPSDAFARL